MRNQQYAALSAVVLIMTSEMSTMNSRQMDVSKTTYGERNPSAPKELGVFSFLIGKWQGTGKTRLPDGTVAEFSGVSWMRESKDLDRRALERLRFFPAEAGQYGFRIRHRERAERHSQLGIAGHVGSRALSRRGSGQLRVSHGCLHDGGRSWSKGQIEMSFRRDDR